MTTGRYFSEYLAMYASRTDITPESVLNQKVHSIIMKGRMNPCRVPTQKGAKNSNMVKNYIWMAL